MKEQRYVVMGAGQVGFHLARSLAQEGHSVTVIELDPERRARIEAELDVLVVGGNGAHEPILEAADVARSDLFLAVSSNDEANLVASLLAKRLGAKRSVVRIQGGEEVLDHREVYTDLFGVDLLLSTQLLTTTRILNEIRGHNTVAVEYFAGGKVQLRRLELGPDSPLTQKPLREIDLPECSLVVAYFRGDELIIPSGDDRAEPGDGALILGKTENIRSFERAVTHRSEELGQVVIVGAGRTGRSVARALVGLDVQVKFIERDRDRAQLLAERFPDYEVIHGDATDQALLKAERIAEAKTFVALSGNDETNLMACLLIQELGIAQELALVQRTDTTRLWRRLGVTGILSPRGLAYERIREYIEGGYNANIVALSQGKAHVLERRLHEASPASGVSLAEMDPPRGLIVGAVARGDKVFVPRGSDRLEVGDTVILFVAKEELPTVSLLFPGRDAS